MLNEVKHLTLGAKPAIGRTVRRVTRQILRLRASDHTGRSMSLTVATSLGPCSLFGSLFTFCRMPDVLILTGPPAAGKSSVAQALAERYDRVAHIEVDTLRHFITPTGYVPPGPARLRTPAGAGDRNACALARNFIAERIAVIIDDVVVTRADCRLYLDALKSARRAGARRAPAAAARGLPRAQRTPARGAHEPRAHRDGLPRDGRP